MAHEKRIYSTSLPERIITDSPPLPATCASPLDSNSISPVSRASSALPSPERNQGQITKGRGVSVEGRGERLTDAALLAQDMEMAEGAHSLQKSRKLETGNQSSGDTKSLEPSSTLSTVNTMFSSEGDSTTAQTSLYGSNHGSFSRPISRQNSAQLLPTDSSFSIPIRYESPYPPQPQQNRPSYPSYYHQQSYLPSQQPYPSSQQPYPSQQAFLPSTSFYQQNHYSTSTGYSSPSAYFYPNSAPTQPPYHQFLGREYSHPSEEFDSRGQRQVYGREGNFNRRDDEPLTHPTPIRSQEQLSYSNIRQPYSQQDYYAYQSSANTTEDRIYSNEYEFQYNPAPVSISSRSSISSSFHQNEIPSSPGPSPSQSYYYPPIPLQNVGTSTKTDSSLPSLSPNVRNKAAILPHIPSHSKFVLWCGNVPGDATDLEMLEFFKSRPTLSEIQVDMEPIAGGDFKSNGVQSIHLIARSNCAFVNYSSLVHLNHAIAVSNGVSIRPGDSRIKELVCRVRRTEDEKKAGVGGQRLGGLHTSYVAAQKMKSSLAAQRTSSSEISLSPPRNEESSNESRSWSNSTSSSFLTKHFSKRFFILKSHDQAELDLSVATGYWSTQTHNEPILDQAYRTSKDTYLIFGANKTGEWYGYARMSGPIFPSRSDDAQTSPPSISETATPLYSSTIPEGGKLEFFPPRPNLLLSNSEQRFVENSPAVITPASNYFGTLELPASNPSKAQSSLSARSAPSALASNLHLPIPPSPPVPPPKKASLDSKIVYQARKSTMEEKIERMDLGGAKSNSFDLQGPSPSVSIDLQSSPPNGRVSGALWNAALELRENDIEKEVDITYGSTSFRVEWIKVQNVPFSRTKHIRNSFNENREVKVSRDGTEIEPIAGELLLEAFWQESDSNSSPSSQRVDPLSNQAPPESNSTTFNPYFAESARNLKRA